MRDNTKLRRFPITLPLLMDIFTTGQTVRARIVEGIPKDSVIMRHHYEAGFYFITIQNEAFDPVMDGDPIPTQVITIGALPPDEPAGWREALDEARAAIGESIAMGETVHGGDAVISMIDGLIGTKGTPLIMVGNPPVPQIERRKVVPIKPEASVPSAEDLDAVAAEEATKAATATEEGVPA